MDYTLEKFAHIVTPERVSTHPDQLSVVAKDESTLPPVTPKAIVWAADADEVAKIVEVCHRERIPITTRGAGSALEGSTIPSPNGIVLDLSRMNRIRNYWVDDLQVQVEPGIIYDNLNNHLKRDGLFFPPSPGGSSDIATIGGMVATNASGIYSVKYGGTRRYVLELEIVTGTGERMKIGNRAVKRSSGYSLIDLIVGSEGTLAVITAVTLRLAGIPEGRRQEAFQFPTEEQAATAVSEMMHSGLDLAAVEFLDRNVIEALNLLKSYNFEVVPCLFLEFHGPAPVLDTNADLAESICAELQGKRLSLADNQRPWAIRHYVTEAIKHRRPGYSIVRNDVAFPISCLPKMVEYCHELGKEYGIDVFTFGHVGMGLLHALMLARKENDAEWKKAHEINDLIIRRAIELGGTISGEHGIGLGHKNLLELEHGASIELMKKIKKQFDPLNILNPGKIFDL
jgi:D-lactate dehydrogenase (cytochrome)